MARTQNFRHTRLERGVALDALQMALTARQPPQGLLHHSDRGSQYLSYEYQQLLAAHGLLSSMSRKGNCWDNAVAESFFATLKLELAYRSHWRSRTQARSEVFEYIELFYNRQRRHSALGYLSPNQFEHWPAGTRWTQCCACPRSACPMQ